MAAGERPPYRVTQTTTVATQIRDLAKRAFKKNRLKALRDSLAEIAHNLELRPLEWGEPTYNPKKRGSIVCHGATRFFFVEYVVFHPEHVVVVLRIIPLPDSRLTR